MQKAELDHAEAMAEQIVTRVLRVDLKQRDIHTHEGLHDFDILFPEGPVPLEVKTATDRDLRRLFAGLMRHGMELLVQGKCDWQLNLRANADVKRLFKEREQLALGLRAMEEEGHTFFDNRRGTLTQGSTVDLFRDLFPEVESAWGYAYPKEPPKIHLLPPAFSGAIGPEAVNPFVTQFLSLIAERNGFDKLKRTEASRRHVFIWLESTLGVESMSFCGNKVPLDRPVLPDPLTDVWLAGYCRGVQVQVWYLPPGEGWRSVGADLNSQAASA